jgi:hypothetical protein
MVLALPADGQGSTNDAIARFLKVMDGISYDATIAVDMLDYADGTPATPEIVDIETNRDVFAVGFGRRLERSVKGKDNGSGVIDWKTATSMRPRLARAFMVMLPGLTYLEYINPDTGYGTFLSDALKNKKIAIRPLDTTPADLGLVGFQVENPSLDDSRKFHIINRIWLDPEHGYMLKVMEWHWKFTNGEVSLRNKMQVEKFLKVDEEMWVPAQATESYYNPGSTNAESEYSMKLDVEHSSFNSIHSDELFLAKSLPGVNDESDGWKWHYPANVLEELKSSDSDIAIAIKYSFHKWRAHWVGLASLGGSIALLFIITLMMRRKRRLFAESS